MSQSSIIAGSLMVAYVVFIIVRGELPCYFQVLGIATDAACPLGQITSNGLSSTSSATTSSTGTSITGQPKAGVGVGIPGIGVGVGVGIGGTGSCFLDGSCDIFGGSFGGSF